jgi:hypothetical protein
MTTQLLSSGEFYKLCYDIIPFEMHLQTFFLYHLLKNSKFWVVTLLSQMNDMYLHINITKTNLTFQKNSILITQYIFIVISRHLI